MKIERSIKSLIAQELKKSKKIIILYGARQVGKTTLAQEIIKKSKYKTLSINADQKKYYDVLSSRDLKKLQQLVEGYELLFLDEAQRVPEIGINLKILVDNVPEIRILVTGSSPLDLANKIKEPLTGRTWTQTLFPISFLELREHFNTFELNDQLEERLIYGSYPGLFQLSTQEERKKYLEELSSSYLYKDVLELAQIKHPQKIYDLLKLLALQIGAEVSTAELATSLSLSKQTVESYIHLLEQSFVIFRLHGFSRNLRKEIAKRDKIYFYDLGIRNALLNQFQDLSFRSDVGKLWENFLVMERMKFLSYTGNRASTYFWRTYTGAELDYIEERVGKLFGYEFKWKKNNSKNPKAWKEAYDGSFQLINRENHLPFILGK